MNRKAEGPFPGGAEGEFTCAGVDCAAARDAAPLLDFPSELEVPFSALLAHFEACEPCAEELRFVRALRAGAPVLHPGFAGSVLGRLAEESASPLPLTGVGKNQSGARRPRFVRAGWGLSAAALLVLALGVGSLWQGSAPPSADGLVASLLAGSNVEPRDEWIVAGAPHLDALSDDLLYTLLQDIES